MAKRVTVQMTDDLDPSKTAETTVTLGLDGVAYEIDLTSKNAGQLRKSLQPYVDAGRRLRGRSTIRPPRLSGRGDLGVDNAAVRAWAASNKIELAARGRIPRSVVEQFKQAMG